MMRGEPRLEKVIPRVIEPPTAMVEPDKMISPDIAAEEAAAEDEERQTEKEALRLKEDGEDADPQ